MTIDETRRSVDPPLWEVPGWWQRFRLVAGISGRGTGPEPFDLGLWGDRPVGKVMTRWRTLRAVFPEFDAVVMAHQVHGNTVLWHDDPSGWVIHDGADGHATDRPGVLLAVTVADCVPIYLAAPGTGTIALLHSGWRGTAAHILEGGVDLIAKRSGKDPRELVMHAGVAISGARYQVGSEVIEGVGRVAAGTGPWFLDLREAIAEQAAGLGIGEVSISGHCTAEPGGPFFSHRGSGGADGRMVAWLGRPREE